MFPCGWGRLGPGDTMILSPGGAGTPQNRACSTDFAKVTRTIWHSFGIPWSQNVHLGTCSLEATSPRIEDDLAMRPARDTSYSRYFPSFTRWASDRRFTYRFKRSHKQQQQQYSEAPRNNAENIRAYLGYFEVLRMSRPHGSTFYHRRRKRSHEEQQEQ